jgi:choline dehydrogenase-like flavoprotein
VTAVSPSRASAPATQPGAPFLRARERRTVAAFAEVLFPAGERPLLTPDAVAARVDAQLQLMRESKRTRSLHLILLVVEYVLPLAGVGVLGVHLRPFSRLSPERRHRLVEAALARTRFKPLRTLSKLKTLLIAAYYSDPAVQASIGFVPVRDRGLDTTPEPRDPVRVHDPADGDTLDVDLCVIGSGAGGAVIAARAAAAGKSVALLEEGPYVRQGEIEHDEHRMVAALYKEHGLQTTVDFGMTILQGKALGGTTFVNNAICFRLGDPGLRSPRGASVLEDWRRLGATIDEAALHAGYDAVEHELGVARVPSTLVGASGLALLDGWRSLDPAAPASGVFRKNLHDCIGCGYCNFACPYGHKLSTLESYVKAVGDHGGYVVPGCHAEKLERRGDTVSTVRARLAGGRALKVNAGVVVVSAGAIGSSVLLMKNGFRRNVGTRFSFNSATPVVAAFDEPQHSWAADQMTAYVDGGAFLLESSFDPPMSVAVGMPGWFGDHMQRMSGYDKLARLGVVVGTEPNGRVKRWSLLRDTFGPVDWRMSGRDLATMKRGIGLAAEIWFAAGARKVFVASFLDCRLDAGELVSNGTPDRQAIAARIDRAIREPGDLLLNSSHPQGGNPMSDDREVGVVGTDFRVHGMRNLFVCDASVFPTSIHINPQLTIMAMADLAWNGAIAEAV